MTAVTWARASTLAPGNVLANLAPVTRPNVTPGDMQRAAAQLAHKIRRGAPVAIVRTVDTSIPGAAVEIHTTTPSGRHMANAWRVDVLLPVVLIGPDNLANLAAPNAHRLNMRDADLRNLANLANNGTTATTTGQEASR